MTYKDLIQTSPKEGSLEFAVEKSSLQAQADLLAVKQQLANAEFKAQNLKSAFPFSLTNLAEAMLDVAELNKLFTSMKAAYEELFPVEPAV